MDESLVPQVEGHMDHPLFLFSRCLLTKEEEIARLQVAEVWCNLNTLSLCSLLGGITRDEYIVQEEGCAYLSAAIHPF